MKKEKEELLARLKNIVLNMPEKPGSYQFYDKDHTIIYVGKAKRLKSRVSSYFHTEVDRFKTKVLVSKICDITYTVVNTEENALLLETPASVSPRSICPEFSRRVPSTARAGNTLVPTATSVACTTFST